MESFQNTYYWPLTVLYWADRLVWRNLENQKYCSTIHTEVVINSHHIPNQPQWVKQGTRDFCGQSVTRQNMALKSENWSGLRWKEFFLATKYQWVSIHRPAGSVLNSRLRGMMALC